jgi:hypothetical protein
VPIKEEFSASGKAFKVRYRLDLLNKILLTHKHILTELQAKVAKWGPKETISDSFESLKGKVQNLYTVYIANKTPQLVQDDMDTSPKLKQWFSVLPPF